MPPTTDTELDESEVLTTTAAPYVENPDHVPNPTDQYGTYDTSGTAGTAHSRLENVSPIFDVAKQQDLVTAARALDPEDTEVPEHLVVKPPAQALEIVDHDAIRERITNAAKAAVENPVVVGGPNATQRAAAEGTDYDAEAEDHEAKAKARAEAAQSEAEEAARKEAEAKAEEQRKAEEEEAAKAKAEAKKQQGGGGKLKAEAEKEVAAGRQANSPAGGGNQP